MTSASARYVFVLGTYRSGTSCTAGVLSELGVGFGDCVWAGRHNPKGYFEHAEARQALIRLFDPTGTRQTRPDADVVSALEEWRRSISRLPCCVVGMKHPLLCMVPHLLHSVLDTPDVRYVAVDRPAHDVIASLRRCNWGFLRGVNLDRLIAHQRSVRDLLFLGQHPHVRVDFDALVDHADSVVRRLIDFIGLEPDVAALERASGFVEARLTHRTGQPRPRAHRPRVKVRPAPAVTAQGDGNAAGSR